MEFSIFAPHCFREAKKLRKFTSICNRLVKSFHEARISVDSLFNKLTSLHLATYQKKYSKLDVFQQILIDFLW